jgi:hypothetical protein
MQMHAVTSTNVQEVGHDGVDLVVQFVNGSRYRYHDVPKSELMNMLGAPSVGGYLNAHIKPHYAYSKIA